jgi:hypothetical protein
MIGSTPIVGAIIALTLDHAGLPSPLALTVAASRHPTKEAAFVALMGTLELLGTLKLSGGFYILPRGDMEACHV